MKKSTLTKNEEKVLYGLTRFPDLTDSSLSNKLNVKLSTLTSIKKRLYKEGYFRILTVPLLNNLGCELLAVIYTQFNPVIPLDERIKTTKKTIEVFDEIFYSVGEQDKGFSISLSQNYTNIGRINEIRTKTFGKVGLLEDKYPNEVIFPFETSNIARFFDFSRVLKDLFSIDFDDDEYKHTRLFEPVKKIDLSKKEKSVFTALVENPQATTQEIGNLVGVSRHTISRMKNNFFENNLLKKITIPNLKKLGFEIMAFYPIQFNPNKSPKKEDIKKLDTPSTIFFANKQFETVIISAYPTYQKYKEDKMQKIRFLKENDFISYTPLIGKYMFERMVTIKDFSFVPITGKIIK